MPYTGVKERTTKRFGEVYSFLNYLTNIEPSNPLENVPIEVKIMKGLFYVHLYGAFEKSINDIIETSIILISSKNVKNNHYEKPLLSIVLSNEIKSLRDVNHKKVINNSIDIFIKTGSSDVIKLNETYFSSSLQNVWVYTLEESLSALGIELTNLETSEKVTVNELVDKRNAVAHGRDSAAEVGEKFRADILRKKMDTITTVTQKIIDLTELNFINHKYIKPTYKRLYS